MNTSNASIHGRGACPPASSTSRRAVGGNGPCLPAFLALAFTGLVPFALGATTPPNQAVTKPDACCAAPAGTAVAASFSKESIYQLDGRFTDDQGRPFALGQLRGRPVVLDLFFASCGYACPLTVTDMLAIRGRLPAALRGQATFVLVSFDPERDTTAALAKYREQRGLDGQWVLLHGDDESVRELAALVGVKYRKEADASFSHSNLLTILNAEGEIVHQRVGLQGGLDEAAAALARVTPAAP